MDSDIMRSVSVSVSVSVPAAGAQALWSEAVSASHRPILHRPIRPLRPPRRTRPPTSHSSPSPRARGEAIPISSSLLPPPPRPTLHRPIPPPRPRRRTRPRTSHSSPSPRARGEAIPISCWFLVPRRKTRRSGYSGLATTPSMSPCDPGTAVHSFVFNASDPAPGMKRQHQGNPCCLRTNGPERPAPQGKHAASCPRQSPSLLACYLRHPSKMTENFHIHHIFVNIFTSHAPFQGASPTPCAPTSTPQAAPWPSALRRRCRG